MMFFSVIIPTYNRKNLLRLALESVLKQTFGDLELIIVDDGSTDKTQELVKSYKDKRINYLRQENKGPSAARNLGILKAKADFICLLDSDDRFRREKLEKTKEYIIKNPDYKIFHTEELWYRNKKYLSQKKEHKKPQGFVFENALNICCISLSTACLHKDVFKKAGLFDESFPACEDYEFWLRATLLYPVKLIPLYLTIKEGGHLSQQSSKKGLDKYRFLAIYKTIKNCRLKPSYLEPAIKNLEEKAAIYIQGAKKREKNKEIKEITDKLNQIKNIYDCQKLS
ncbi:MAG: glycosyltransferase [Candidatus Omnitrophica bacterium]|nr:glycosyltransferase [Candidatus Omnitrophota bacterium]